MKESERFVYDMFTDLVAYNHKDIPNVIFYKKDDYLLLQYNYTEGILICEYSKFWKILYSITPSMKEKTDLIKQRKD